ncbi:MAG: hypothetical protein A2Z88_01435 [Omnitrophica WOR_2 bacterium GWA2_47_8]|nr:MAG: hypothetical protein A2Z88_01435 [Omnitrophica WOR_2 bacterium GWA2_47_8]
MDKFRKDFPHKFVNAGIAEQNAILISAGMALTGKRVFAYAIAPFITLRCIEQTRVNSGIMNIPITIVGVSGGFGYVDAGPTHHSTEDIAMMRVIPHITVQSASDAAMASYFAERSMVMENTNYVRLDRQPSPDLYKPNSDFSNGLTVLKEGKSYMVATGAMTPLALTASEALAKKGIDVGVIDVYEFPIHVQPFLNAVKYAEKLITLEEHYLPAGLGGAVCEVLMDNQVYKPIDRIALPQEKGYCYEYGERESLRRYFGIDLESVIQRVTNFIPKSHYSNV